MFKLSADWVYPIASEPIQNGVVVTDDAGVILAIGRREDHDPASLDVRRGALVPGFVNAHCHLELSHMLGKVDTGTGLIPFITGVVTQRNATAEVIEAAIQKAYADMLEGGIVGLGDISNVTDSFAAKQSGRMRSYTFVELFDFLQNDRAKTVFAEGKKVYETLEPVAGSAKSFVPHAPYTVSPHLFEKVNAANHGRKVTVSIHNQETPPENELFEHGTGGFYGFYGKFGISLEEFRHTGQTSIHYALKHLDPMQRTLFVHNTLSTRDDILAAQAWSDGVFWATCPNANLYIENRLPDYSAFMDCGARVCIGTDSLTSNWQLSILEEMKTIKRFQSYVPFETILRWATLNGAQALGFDDTLGSLEVGKRPGVLLLEGVQESLTSSTTVCKMV
ncbi:MAG: amidohydrolase family protein [Saprospiraceae bacterium]|nr:amidohydrolase family protein [Saprospiraceae bacterium]